MIELLKIIDKFEQISESIAETHLNDYRQAIWPTFEECLLGFEQVFLKIGPDHAIKSCLIILQEYLSVFLLRKKRYLHYAKAIEDIARQWECSAPHYRAYQLRSLPEDPAAMAFQEAIFQIMIAQERLIDPDQTTQALDTEHLRDFEPWHKYCVRFIDVMIGVWCYEAMGNVRISRYEESSVKLIRNRIYRLTTVSKLRDFRDVACIQCH